MLGLVREMVASNYFGAAGRINAFTVAFQIPNLVRALVADAALSSAFVPVFSELLEKGERKRAWRVASTLFWLMLLGLGALSAIFILIAPVVISPFHAVDPNLAAGLSRVLFPIVALLGVSGIVVGILNSYDHFTVPAIWRRPIDTVRRKPSMSPRVAKRDSDGKSTVATATENIPCGSM